MADQRDVSNYVKPLQTLELSNDAESRVIQGHARRRGSGAVTWGTVGMRSLLAIFVLVLITGFLWVRRPWWIEEIRVPMLAKDEIVILRTHGGRLDVSTLIKNEEFAWQTTYTCPIANCGALFGKTISKVRVSVHYTYEIPLTGKWSLKFRETYFELKVPEEKPNLPPGLDMASMQIDTIKGWMSPSGTNNQASMLKHLGPELESRARRSDYVAAQREEARKTVSEFARKWMVEQGAGKDKKDLPVKVIFEGEGHADTPSAQ